MNSKIRWGRKQKRRNLKEKGLREKVRVLESDLDDAYSRLDRLEAYCVELAEKTGCYLPSFGSRYFRER